MKNFGKIIGKGLLIVLACLVASIPFLILVDMNITPHYRELRYDGLFRFASIAFHVEFILSLVAVFLLFVRQAEENPEPDGPGCGLLFLGGAAFFANWQLSDNGEYATGMNYGSYDLTAQMSVAPVQFWIYLSLVYLCILFAVIMVVSGKLSD